MSFGVISLYAHSLTHVLSNLQKYTENCKTMITQIRDVNRGSTNRNSLQIRVLEIEFSNSKLDITFCISAQAVTQAAGDWASVSAQMARRGVAAQRALSTVTRSASAAA